MKEQNYTNHARYVTGFHFILGGLLLTGFICSVINIWLQWSQGEGIFSPVLIALLFVCGMFLFIFTRQFATKVQDRAIRAEENLRYFILTHNPLDKRITIGQVIALRFASDDELIVLADRAANEQMTPDEIKNEIKNWRADIHRV